MPQQRPSLLQRQRYTSNCPLSDAQRRVGIGWQQIGYSNMQLAVCSEAQLCNMAVCMCSCLLIQRNIYSQLPGIQRLYFGFDIFQKKPFKYVRITSWLSGKVEFNKCNCILISKKYFKLQIFDQLVHEI